MKINAFEHFLSNAWIEHMQKLGKNPCYVIHKNTGT